MKLRQLMFVLPNLFTVSSIFCGFYALTLCAGEAGPAQMYQAALAIFFGVLFDGFDGRVARLTKTQSQFGMELDSLADVISFGVAPAMLVYKWALQPLGFIGIFISFMFAACGALRLARFNVLAQRSPHGGASAFFVGLPIPLAAGVVLSMVIAHHARGGDLPEAARVPIAAVVVFLSALMVSTVRYRTFKDLKLSRKSAAAFVFVLALGVVIATQFHPAFVLVAYFSAYLLFGLVESVLILRRYVVNRRAASAAALLDEVDEDEDESDATDIEDDEVL